ncbi:FGGY family carbohydrate kinase, partial [Bacteroides sp.]
MKEQDPDEWYGAFCSLSKEMLEIIPAAEIGAIIFSGQMQDVISVGTEGKALRNAILYSDGRADEQARVIIREAARRNVVPLGDAYIAEITGNHFDGSMPLAKILWLKENEPDIYARTACFLISSKDYIIGRLTSVFAGDMTACSTAGAMDLDKKIWSEELIGAAGVDIKKFPKLFYGHECVGTVTETGATESGYPVGTKVYAGTGDAGATTLASGILAPGEYN